MGKTILTNKKERTNPLFFTFKKVLASQFISLYLKQKGRNANFDISLHAENVNLTRLRKWRKSF